MNDLIYEKECSIPKLLANDIILLYEKSVSSHYQGLTQGGVNIDIKNTTDFSITDNTHVPEWNKINNFLKTELFKHIRNYHFEFCKKYPQFTSPVSNSSDIYYIDTLQIQRYKKNVGHFKYHNDYSQKRNGDYRILTYIWYLNDVIDGGETEFFGDNKCRITPKSGKIVIFPATWTHMHSGLMPRSDDKYIITGWLYIRTIQQ
jgi:Rps23 Pro-64 3,4-dihydroxylase Tpa1-like proline 4-hydroxylase